MKIRIMAASGRLFLLLFDAGVVVFVWSEEFVLPGDNIGVARISSGRVSMKFMGAILLEQ